MECISKNLKDSLHLNLSCFTLSQFHLPLPSSSCNAVFSDRQEPISRNDSENSESADGVKLENSSTQKKKDCQTMYTTIIQVIHDM